MQRTMDSNKKLNQPKVSLVNKGWGYELHIANSEKYCGKILHFVKGKKCSFHFHKLKTEDFYILSGKIKVIFSDSHEMVQKTLSGESHASWEEISEVVILTQGDNFHVPAGRIHQMIAIEPSEIMEVSTQDFPEDSYRLVKGD